LPEPPEARTGSEFGKISPPTLRESVANYDQLASFLRNTPLATYLNDDD
jgi:hypothetical protein